MLIAGTDDAYRYLHRALGRFHTALGMRTAELRANVTQARALGAPHAAAVYEARVGELEHVAETVHGLLADFEPTRLGLDP